MVRAAIGAVVGFVALEGGARRRRNGSLGLKPSVAAVLEEIGVRAARIGCDLPRRGDTTGGLY